MRADEFVTETDEPLFIGGHRVPRNHPMYDVLMRKAAELKASDQTVQPKEKPRRSVRAVGVEVPDPVHISPSGVATNMSPADDDYHINYGKKGAAADRPEKPDWREVRIDPAHQVAHRIKKTRYWPHR